LISAIEAEQRAYPDVELTIASDSQQRGQQTEFVTVVTMVRPGKGGRVFFCREFVPRIKDLRSRLWQETWRSTELAMELTKTDDAFDSPSINVAAVHIDANIDPKHASSKYVEELVGLVMGQGFRAVVKPEAWAASHAADHAVKHKEERRKPHAEGVRKRRAG
jgi:predicted RNase H-related nuclease YkuK (DUF458 family)